MKTLITALLLTLAVGPALAQEQAPRMGGVLKIAMIGEPPSLDLHTTTATITQQITWHVYEGLFTYDKSFTPIPMLAESHTATDGGPPLHHHAAQGRAVPQRQGDDRRPTWSPPSQRWGKIATLGKTIVAERRGRRGQGPVRPS